MKNWLLTSLKKIGSVLGNLFKAIPFGKLKNKGNLKWVMLVLLILFLCISLVGWFVSREPGIFDVRKVALTHGKTGEEVNVIGFTTTVTLIEVAETLLDKPGGYLSNDITPPAIFIDNMPSWEFGALIQVRDLTRALRNDMSRSRSQSEEILELGEAEPQFNIDNSSWIFPSAEDNYRDGIASLKKYSDRLVAQNQENVQFYARADNLRDWLLVVEKRLGGLSQRLSASVGQARINTDLAGDSAATQSTFSSSEVMVQTPWLKLDNVFYEARGSTWALLHFLRAIEVDFEGVLEKKNARALVSQIIRELEGTQRTVWSPVILNGNGFGIFANHSLVMAAYVSRANAAVIELRGLLRQG